MSSTDSEYPNYQRGHNSVPIQIDSGGDVVVVEDITKSGQVYLSLEHPYRVMFVRLSNNQIKNNDTDVVTVSLSIVDGLEVSRDTDRVNATVLDYDGDVVLSIDGSKTTKTLTNGSVEFDLTTDKPAGSEIEIVAESLSDHPAESDSATIEVVSQ